jgi:hypothetical protein
MEKGCKGLFLFKLNCHKCKFKIKFINNCFLKTILFTNFRTITLLSGKQGIHKVTPLTRCHGDTIVCNT